MGILLLLGSRFLPAPLQVAALLLAGALVVTSLWANNRGWRRWWPLCCGFLATLAFAGVDVLGKDQVVVRNVLAGLLVAFLIAGLAPTLAGLIRELGRVISAVVDARKIIREVRKGSTQTP